MVENDIYNNKRNYEKYISNVERLLNKPTPDDKRRKYYIKNSDNLQYYHKLFKTFSVLDISYIRRLRLLKTLQIITHATEKDLSKCEREEINDIVAYFNSQDKSPRTKRDFIVDMKYIWKNLFPEKDERGRIDETLVPYVVRHLSSKIDKSREKLRDDKLSLEDIDKLIAGFSNDPRMQAFIAIMIDSLVRPQELLYVKIKNVDLYDNYAKIYISEHGKEGTKMLQIIDSYTYLTRLLNNHPKRKDPESYLFVNIGHVNQGKQMSIFNINKMIKAKCNDQGIKKKVTAYSFKRNGVTIARLRGDSDVTIQHKAGWTSTNQLKTYDMSNAEEAMRIELIKRGIVKADDAHKNYEPLTKTCIFCETVNAKSNEVCDNCHRILDRNKIIQQQEAMEVMQNILQDKDSVSKLTQALQIIKAREK